MRWQSNTSHPPLRYALNVSTLVQLCSLFTDLLHSAACMLCSLSCALVSLNQHSKVANHIWKACFCLCHVIMRSSVSVIWCTCCCHTAPDIQYQGCSLQAVKQLDTHGILDIRIHLTTRKQGPSSNDSTGQVSLLQLVWLHLLQCGNSWS